jgi:hypothetical protein
MQTEQGDLVVLAYDTALHLVGSEFNPKSDMWTDHFFVRFEVSMVVTMKNGVFWDVMPCGSCKNRRFGGT